MNSRERYLQTILFGNPDRIPLEPGNPRMSTRTAWREQGLPESVSDTSEHAYRRAGGKLPWPRRGRERLPVNERMIPQFEEKVLERRARTQIVQDWKGNICEISNDYTVEYLRDPIDFVTRRWISCPVKSREDWPAMRERYDPDDPGRYPHDEVFERTGLEDRSWPVVLSLPGPFWQLREWLGLEKLLFLFYDDPHFVEEMIAFWTEFIARLLANTFRHVIPDEVGVSEDMAYKNFSMISPEMTRELLLPAYRRWGDLIRSAGCPIYFMDSDGFVGELIPVWIEAGINACGPMEVAAGNDIVEFRRQFGSRMAYRGGVDKRAMAQGGTAIENEIDRIRPVIEDRGFVPSCDHGVPPDVSWPDFVHYVGLLARATGW